jgi:Ca-activated chloride channel family protein
MLRHNTRAAIMSTLSELSADGATNMSDALNLAIGRARHAPSSHPVRRVVMISDGRATAGHTSTHTLAQIAENGTQFGVQVTSLGVGLDYDEDTLNALAVRSSGRLYHLSDPREMAGIIKSELNLLDKTMATNAAIEIVAAPGVQLIAADGVRSSWGQNRSLRVPLGTMFSGQRREVLVRFRMTGDLVEGSAPIVSTRLHFDDPSDGGIARVQEVVVRATLTHDMSMVREHQNHEVQAIIAMQEASTMAAQARSDVSSGNFDEADVQLARAETKLRERAQHAKSKKDQARITAAADSVAQNRRAVQGAAAAPPAARASAARKSSLELNDFAMEAQGY